MKAAGVSYGYEEGEDEKTAQWPDDVINQLKAMDELKQNLASDNPKAQHDATVRLRKLLSIGAKSRLCVPSAHTCCFQSAIRPSSKSFSRVSFRGWCSS